MNSRSVWFRWNISLLVIIAFLLAACQPQQAAPSIPTLPPLTSTEQLPSTGDQPQVVVNDQKTDGASIVVAKVFSPENGWIAIHPELPNGNLGVAIGETFVKKGSNDNVTVQLEQGRATQVMYAMLHKDTGILGKYEFPDADPPVFAGTQMVNQEFAVTFGQAATVEVPDQVVNNGVVKVPVVESKGPGWLAIYTEKDEKPGDPIGFKAVQDGETKNVTVQVTQNQVTPVLYALLFTDSGVAGQFEPGGADQPQSVNGKPIQPEFRSNSEPATMFMEAGGMYMQVTQTAGGSGTAAPGENMTSTQVAEATQVPSTNSTAMVMEGTATGMTSTETAMTSPEATMNMPTTAGTEAASAISQGMNMVEVIPKPGEEPAIKVSDQSIKDGQVIVDDVVSSNPGWIAIYNSQQGQPNVLIGKSPIKEGDNPNVAVQIDTNQLTDQLFAMMHVDAGKPGVFEFPGPDALASVGVRMVQASFMINTEVAQATQTTTTTEPYVKISDQALRGGTVSVAEVFSNGPGWIGLHTTDQNGNVGPGIAYTPVNNGLNQNVLVKINDLRQATKVMYAMLHVDQGQVGVLEFPGPDQPAKTHGNVIMMPFNVTGGLIGQPTTINLSNTQNPYLIDSQGMSLYTSLADSVGKSNCDALCRNTWLPLLVTGKLQPGEGVNLSKLSFIALPNGSKQVTYGGFPLYYFVGDTKTGDINGQGKDGQWFLSTP